MSPRPATGSHRGRAPSTSASATPATLPPGSSGLWILPVLWKTRAIRSALTEAWQKARFPQHLGRRRRRPQAPQAPYFCTFDQEDKSRISKIRRGADGRELTEQRRYAPTSVHVRRNQCSPSPESVFTFSEIPTLAWEFCRRRTRETPMRH